MRLEISILKTTILYERLSGAWFEIARDSIRKRGVFTAAICGGTTPLGFYRYLSRKKYPLWKRTHIFVTDERFVPSSHNEYNGKMIRANLIDRVGLPKGNVHFVDTDKKILQAATRQYQRELKVFFDLGKSRLPKFDLILLGLGEDGHTASLFPPSKGMGKNKKGAIVSTVNPSGQKRISLSLAAINNARNVFFMVTGKKKASILREVLYKKNSRLPATRVASSGKVRFFLDKAAGTGVA